jgi:hypothetical protein
MKLKKAIRVSGTTIPAGTNLQFSAEGYATYAGKCIAKSLIPEAAIESVSQKRLVKTLTKSIRLGDTIIPKGTKLTFGAENNAMFNGVSINLNQIPAIAFENASEYKSPAKLKMAVTIGKTIIPAGESLMFNAEGKAMYGNESISIYDIPSAAFEMDEQHQDAHNAVDSEKAYKPIDKLEPGDLGTNAEGETIRFLGKAVGKSGYDALVGQFGDASGKTFEEITAGMTPEEIEAANFVCYTIPDGTVCIGIYGADHAVATESDEGEVVDFAEIVSGDNAVDAEGKPVTIVSKGEGTVWCEKMRDALKLDCPIKGIMERTGLDEDALKNMNFVVVIDKDNTKSIDIYGSNGVKVMKQAE